MALTIEDGTGVAGADSYVTLAEVVAFLTAYEPASALTAWSALSTAEQERHCRRATQYLDLAYGPRFLGRRVEEDQALAFPREGIVTDDGFEIDSDTIPASLKSACCETAWRSSLGNALLDSQETPATIGSESVTVGPITENITYVGGKPSITRTVFPRVRAWLWNLTGAPGAVYPG
jgi:hypothetical protein